MKFNPLRGLAARASNILAADGDAGHSDEETVPDEEVEGEDEPEPEDEVEPESNDHEEEEEMDPKKDKDAAQTAADTAANQSAIDTAVSTARVEERAAERQRMTDVFADDNSVGRERIAVRLLAGKGEMTAEEISATLAEMPKGQEASDKMLDDLAEGGTPELGAGTGGEGGGTQTAAERILANQARFTGRKPQKSDA